MLEGEVKAKATKLSIYMKELIPERINNAMALHLDFQKALSSTFYLSLSKSCEEEAGYTLECLSHKWQTKANHYPGLKYI